MSRTCKLAVQSRVHVFYDVTDLVNTTFNHQKSFIISMTLSALSALVFTSCLSISEYYSCVNRQRRDGLLARASDERIDEQVEFLLT